MPRYPYLFTILNLVLFMIVVAALMMGWLPDMTTGIAMLAFMVVVLDVALLVVLWRRRQG